MKYLDLNSKPKTVIAGVPRDFDQAVLDARIQQWSTMYGQTSHSCEQVRGESSRAFLQSVADKLALGFTLDNGLPISFEYPVFVAWVTKPQAEQEADLVIQAEKLKSEYITELEQERQQYRTLLIQQLKEKDDLKEAQAAEKAAAKRLSEYERLASDCFKELVIPD